MTAWKHLKGKNVTVYASGIAYRGVVVELGVSSLLLRAPAGFREIPWERVTRIEEVPSGPRPTAGTRAGS